MNKIIFVMAVLAGGIIYAFVSQKPSPLTSRIGRTVSPLNDVRESSADSYPLMSVIASSLEVPWALAFLPDGNLLVTERTGSIKMIDFQNEFKITDMGRLEEIRQIGEGGLLGIAVSPRYEQNKQIFVFYTYTGSGNNVFNKLVRYKLENKRLSEKKDLITEIAGSQNHNGGRIKFGPDNYLYITTGDAQEPSLAQSKESLSGKILRVDEEGKPAPGNPFGNAVFSYGHRNPQGLAWDGSNLYETEHGPTAMDEVNTIIKGENYGWPEIRGDEKNPAMQSPLFHSGTSTWAPSGAVYLDSSLYFAGLRGSALYRLSLQNGAVKFKEYFKNEQGRLREVILGPDGMLYVTTSNRDGRASPAADDDRILRVNPSLLD